MEAKPLYFSKNNSILLNIIRFVSAELVVLAHIAEYHPNANLGLLHNAGNFAVGVFFILSGMLIATSAWNKQMKSTAYGFKAFFFDRFARIYSALVPALVIVLIVDFIAYKSYGAELKNIDIQTTLGNLLMLQEFPLIDQASYIVNKPWFDALRIPFFGSDLPLWTLAIEWWLYLFFGWIALAKFHRSTKWITVALFLSVVPLFQLFIGSRMGAGVTLIWFFGVLMATLLKDRKSEGRKEIYLKVLQHPGSLIIISVLAGMLYYFVFLVFGCVILWFCIIRDAFKVSRKERDVRWLSTCGKLFC